MKIECPKCGNSISIKNPVTQAGGRKGGKAKVKKGFASKEVQAKAQATLRANRSRKAGQ